VCRPCAQAGVVEGWSGSSKMLELDLLSLLVLGFGMLKGCGFVGEILVERRV
jgi:hypothetical protein